MAKASQAQSGRTLSPRKGGRALEVRATPSGRVEASIAELGSTLPRALLALIRGLNGSSAGPVALAKLVGVDKVLASRILKATRSADPFAALYALPGPGPLRAFVRAAARRGVDSAAVAQAEAHIARFDMLIGQVGDRSLLDSILSGFIPASRAEFELRRKQAAFKAMSQLKGVQADGIIATCVLGPSADPALLDVVWLHGLTGLHRVRPGVTVKVSSRRMSVEPNARRAVSLDGTEIDGTFAPVVPEFCTRPLPEVQVRRAGQSLFYTLGGEGFGAGSSVDVAFAEINRAEMKRPSAERPGRGSYFFAEAMVPARSVQFDMVVHRDLFAGGEPSLRLHETALEGVADPFDEARELDRLDMLETITPLGTGLSRARSSLAPWYPELVGRAIERMAWEAAAFRVYRCVVAYPLYGSQISMLFGPGG